MPRPAADTESSKKEAEAEVTRCEKEIPRLKKIIEALGGDPEAKPAIVPAAKLESL
jgi:hypothetical protein